MTVLHAERLPASALPHLAAALRAAGLPDSDVAEAGRIFFAFFSGVERVGFGGLEGAPPDMLLRSLAVEPGCRGEGHGGRMLAFLEHHARAFSTVRLHLLTTTAEPFFLGHGYRRADRAAAPAAIRGSTEFTSLCPASARYLVKAL